MNENTGRATDILLAARTWLGTPYVHQASRKQVGCDCLGLIRGVWREVVGAEPEHIPAYSSAWAEFGGREELRDAANRHFQKIEPAHMQPADILLFRMRSMSVAKHLGILSAPNKFIHAYEGNTVVESALSTPWKKLIAGVFRFPDCKEIS